MRKVTIHCPICDKTGFIAVEEDIVSTNERGITAVTVGKYIICVHSFVTYIDNNFVMRDSFATDFTIELPTINIDEIYDLSEEEELYKDIDLYLLLINIKVIELAYIVKALLLKKDVLYINDLDLIHDHLIKLLKIGFTDSFDYHFSIINSREYKKNKKKYKNHIIIENKKIINDERNQLDSKNIQIVSSIIEKFLSETNQESSIIILKNELRKPFIICNEIQTILETYRGEKKLDKKKLLDLLNEKYHIKIQFKYLEFLLEILNEYFEYDLSKLSDFYIRRLGL